MNYEENHRAVDYDEAVSNAPCSDRPEPLVDAVIAAWDAYARANESNMPVERKNKARDEVLAVVAALAGREG